MSSGAAGEPCDSVLFKNYLALAYLSGIGTTLKKIKQACLYLPQVFFIKSRVVGRLSLKLPYSVRRL